jgi:threonine dehydratase
MRAIDAIPLDAIRAAQKRIAGVALRTPLLRFDAADRVPQSKPPTEIHLKLENLQPLGSFKVRGAGNAMRAVELEQLAAGVWTPSAGNMAQGVAWNAQLLGVRSTAVVPEHVPRTKLAALERLGARVLRVPFETWWHSITSHEFADAPGVLVHPVSDPHVIAGNGTIGLEILDDLPDVETLLVPYGGGGLSVGIASAIRALRPHTRVYACEVETAAPLAAAFAAGAPQEIMYTPSFVDGIGGRAVLHEMWPAARALLAGSIVVSLAEVCTAIRLLVERSHVVAEGAGAAAVAAALSGRAGSGRMACVVSGGNIDNTLLTTILRGEIPVPERS